MRNSTKKIMVGNVQIGANNHVVIQSMTNTPTKNINQTVTQINELVKNGCEIVRVAVLDVDDARAIKQIKKLTTIPIVADIHFDYHLALLAIDNGADKIRINPGNIGSVERIKAIVDKCTKKNIPIRIGVNSGSVEKEFLEQFGGPTVDALIASMDKAIELFESMRFYNLVLSIKTTNLEDTISVNKIMAQKYVYPIHVGLTEAGTINSGIVRSSYVLGTILNKGIGNTIRVSLHGNPVNELSACKEILAMCHLYDKPTLIVCPTCGRTMYDMTKVVMEIEEYIKNIHRPLKIAIMGCVVNGPGEASNADIGIAGGNKCAVLFKKGKVIRKIDEDNIALCLKEEIKKLVQE